MECPTKWSCKQHNSELFQEQLGQTLQQKIPQMSVWTGSNLRCRAHFQGAQTVAFCWKWTQRSVLLLLLQLLPLLHYSSHGQAALQWRPTGTSTFILLQTWTGCSPVRAVMHSHFYVTAAMDRLPYSRGRHAQPLLRYCCHGQTAL